MDYDSNDTLSMHAQSLSLASAIDVNPFFDPQATLTTVPLTQREMQWLQLLHSRPAFTATNSKKDMQQWTEFILATMPLDMQKWMATVLNLSEMMSVSGAVTFPTPIVSVSPTEGIVSGPPSDSVEASTLSFGQNDEAGSVDDEDLPFENLTSSSSMKDLSDLVDLTKETNKN
jgi:hypothetical protein